MLCEELRWLEESGELKEEMAIQFSSFHFKFTI